MATSTVENYLKAILHLQEGDEVPTVGRIAEELGVTPGTVTTMMRNLSDEGLIDYIPRKGLKLRSSGRAAALRVVRRHRLIELFLVEVMKLDWSEVHEEAEILEHVVSTRLVDRMDEMLGHPTHDPHGDPIPGKDGKLPATSLQALSSAEPGEYRIVRVSDEDSNLLEWLDGKGLQIGESVMLLRPDAVAGMLELKRRSGGTVHLGDAAADSIFVEIIS
ncbi:MAG: metal-dependent transcriptional regulator [Verrucomicrobiales bacterium]|nr:metal-dependent transcriptional regulator [Verrucomicrobiales bacterium]